MQGVFLYKAILFDVKYFLYIAFCKWAATSECYCISNRRWILEADEIERSRLHTVFSLAVTHYMHASPNTLSTRLDEMRDGFCDIVNEQYCDF